MFEILLRIAPRLALFAIAYVDVADFAQCCQVTQLLRTYRMSEMQCVMQVTSAQLDLWEDFVQNDLGCGPLPYYGVHPRTIGSQFELAC